ncbi:MAG: ribulose-phosphate 3-epimerase [Deltaproteobacteria bacterium]
MGKDIKVAPSILSADFSRLGAELSAVMAGGADLVHVDVMDGHFVPNITIGPVVVKDIRKATPLPLDVHLMIEDPEKYVGPFVKAGADMLTVHVETVTKRKVEKIRKDLGGKVKLGISLNPPTPLSKILPFLEMADFVLVMSVNPGFGGQEFIPGALGKIRELRKRFKGDISVDGGINEATGRLCVDAGANILAAGSYIFGSDNYSKAIRRLKCATR